MDAQDVHTLGPLLTKKVLFQQVPLARRAQT